MTEQQIEKTIDDLEARLPLKTLRRALIRSITSLWKGISAVYRSRGLAGSAFTLWLLLALAMLPGFISLFIYLFFLALFSESLPEDTRSVSVPIIIASPFVALLIQTLYVFLAQVKQPKVVRIWKLFVEKYTHEHGRLSKEARKLVSRISSLYQLDDEHNVEEGYRQDDGPRILPVKQAARLLHIYEQEQRRILSVDKSIAEINSRHDDLVTHLEVLKEQGERRKDAEDTLKELSEAREKLSGTKGQLEKSIRNLSSILKTAEDERDARASHRYIDKVIESTSLAEPREIMERDVLKKLEERIANEIDSYMQIEKKLRQEFDNVIR